MVVGWQWAGSPLGVLANPHASVDGAGISAICASTHAVRFPGLQSVGRNCTILPPRAIYTWYRYRPICPPPAQPSSDCEADHSADSAARPGWADVTTKFATEITSYQEQFKRPFFRGLPFFAFAKLAVKSFAVAVARGSDIAVASTSADPPWRPPKEWRRFPPTSLYLGGLPYHNFQIYIW